jgi:hypothetical protein
VEIPCSVMLDPSLHGLPLPPAPGHPPPTLEGILLAAAGPPRFAQRLAEIDGMIARLGDRVTAEAERLEAIYGAGSELARARLGREIASWDLSAVNRLIDAHNRWYPVERGLPMDPLTGDYVPVSGRPYRRPPLDPPALLLLWAQRAGGG